MLNNDLETEKNTLLHIRGLKIEARSDVGWTEVVKGIDLFLQRGEVVGLIGESGAGKSTIGLAALGYARVGCRISGGTIHFDGRELSRLSERDLQGLRGTRISYVAQSAASAFNPAHKLIEQYTEVAARGGQKTHAVARKEAIELYRKLDLPNPEHFGDRYPHQVSGGQLQRAMVAMAMACGPDLIVFDEPTTALDVTTQIEVLTAIKDVIKDFNTAAIYITHDLAVVAQVADRIMVLRYGELVEEGKTGDVLTRPVQDYTQRLLGTAPPKTTCRNGNQSILDIDNISASYGSFQALADISIKVPKASTVAIVGESGSGKSSLARVVSGLLRPTSGTITFDGARLAPTIDARSQDLRRRIQLVHQTPDTSLNPRHRVADIIGRPLSFYHGLTREQNLARTIELLEQIELDSSYLFRFPGELSGGQKQRICIARALAANPDLIICDEVTSALDQLVAQGILKLLTRLQNDLQISYLFITHDLSAVQAVADEIVVMRQGRVVEQGSRDQVLTPPHHGYTELLLGSVPQMDPSWLDGVRQKRALAS